GEWISSRSWHAWPSAFDRKNVDTVLVDELAPAHRIIEFHAEDIGGTDTALGGEGAAEHRPAGRDLAVAGEEILGRAHRRDRAFLIELAVRPGAQHQLVPVRLHLVVAPRVLGDRFPAELLREGDADGLGLAIGVVGTDGDPQAVGLGEEYKLDLAARLRPRHLDRVRIGDKRRSDAVEDRRGLRRLHADLGQLHDVLLQLRFIAPGPTGDDDVAELHHATFRIAAASGTS